MASGIVISSSVNRVIASKCYLKHYNFFCIIHQNVLLCKSIIVFLSEIMEYYITKSIPK
jgi:hypothetical protein